MEEEPLYKQTSVLYREVKCLTLVEMSTIDTRTLWGTTNAPKIVIKHFINQ